MNETKSRRQDIAERAGLVVSRNHQDLAIYILTYLEIERDDCNQNWLSSETIAHAIDAFKGVKE